MLATIFSKKKSKLVHKTEIICSSDEVLYSKPKGNYELVRKDYNFELSFKKGYFDVEDYYSTVDAVFLKEFKFRPVIIEKTSRSIEFGFFEDYKNRNSTLLISRILNNRIPDVPLQIMINIFSFKRAR